MSTSTDALTARFVTENHRNEVDGEFVHRVLRPYREHCRYLQRAMVEFAGEPAWNTMKMIGEFGIDQSCYIDDTGHFNAVEFNICYNQLAYVHLAYCIGQGLMPALAGFTLETFFEKQLSHFLIANINSSYHAQLNPRRFYGEVQVGTARKSTKYAILKTHCAFHDDSQGRSDGDVKLVVLQP